MLRVITFRALLATVCCLAGAVGGVTAAEPVAVDFNRQIQPLLSRKCLVCHGPDANKRQADLRLDVPDSALQPLPSGATAVVPAKLEESELWLRVTSSDPSERMPPGDTPLTPAEIELLRKWIESGAKWQRHWAFVPPQRSAVPDVNLKSWPLQIPDRFLLSRWEALGILPSADADRITLIRRVTHDLTGLPPTPADVNAFLADESPAAFEKVVDRLLASPEFGERLAVWWLDLVRYADTVGYHGDQERQISPYRDYVIQAFNQNLPFDQFTIEQLAGDLLPEPTQAQQIASGFNMLGMTTIEGGAQAKEYLAKYAADRVRTTAITWLGGTLGCAECHDHKYDPYTARDFYSLSAFFADIKQAGVANPEPNLLLMSETQAAAREQLVAQVRSAEAAAKGQPKGSDAAQALAKARQELAALDATFRKTITTVSTTPRDTRILRRGDWQDEEGDLVTPAIPAFLGHLTPETRANRLDLAHWLVSADNPLTSRVIVNRLWKLCFGRGLAGSLDDFGLQGERTEFPELLDWLAVEFRETGWDIKRTLRLLVTSHAYQQSSLVSSDLLERDPLNRLFARQGRFRIEAEFVRDRALAVSGLLVRQVGGDSVHPYQPDKYYQYLNFPTRTYVSDTGDKQYRRGLYTHWQRTYLHPWLIAFDAPSREECTAERPVSSTPQQALVLLNDPTFVEAARALGARILHEGGTTDADRMTWAVRELLSRQPTPRELDVLLELQRTARVTFVADPAAAAELTKVGLSPLPADVELPELAAWSEVARALLNLQEAIQRE